MAWSDLVNATLGASLNTFGQTCTHRPKLGGNYTRNGIFSAEFTAIDPDTGYDIIQNRPVFGIRVNDWTPLPDEDDELETGGVTYIVTHTEPDGEGGATVFLKTK